MLLIKAPPLGDVVDVQGKLYADGLENQGNAYFKFGTNQLVTLDSGSSYLPMLHLKSYSSNTADATRARKDVLIVRASGRAELAGKLALHPGSADNEAVTYGQLASVAESIEQLAPSYERGKYNLSMDEVTSSSESNGKYNLVRKNTSSDNNAARRACEDARDTCKRIPDNDPIDCDNQFMQCEAQIPAVGSVDIYTDDFSKVEQIKFSKVDADGTTHQWSEVQVGQLIDVFNDSNSDYLVAKITAKEGTSVITLTVDVLQSSGKATGAARIKVFTLNDDVGDLANYVRKTGDTMTGTLAVESTVPLGLFVKGNTTAGNSILYVQNSSGKTQFRVRGDGEVQAGHDEQSAFIASKPHDVVTKKVLDDALARINAPSPYRWKRKSQSSGTAPNGYYYIYGGFLYLGYETLDGIELRTSDAIKDTKANDFNGAAVMMSFWKEVNGHYDLIQTVEAFKWRGRHYGFLQLEIHRAKIDWSSINYEEPHYISLPSFF